MGPTLNYFMESGRSVVDKMVSNGLILIPLIKGLKLGRFEDLAPFPRLSWTSIHAHPTF
jgi:hypothetical protein